MLERSRRRFELTPNPRHLKYESYSKPEEMHFQLRIIWLLSIVTQPLQSGEPSMSIFCVSILWYGNSSILSY
ncbi:hypothetical protein DA077_08230 [Lactiplantibacillus paraplantarum]|uniref:Uncharacterized protein n=1 Tax=Lactiplantibacillus paraplantarum TaxID=60520 RepID=A0AAD0X832_9LACO|nr:hypothetical protein DA077_08230 [Lactiplantibacillus paraplantarum]AYJ38766.1 hypothetical protein LP667_08050 [Lactiplantibacillus paraplantarum]MCT4455861.1 hypothetical protein [Lactiplantibacillus paraplantarum]